MSKRTFHGHACNLGMRRLEAKYREEESVPGDGGSPQSTAYAEDLQKRSWRVLVALQNAANRSKWISSTESALLVHTEALHWSSHNEVPMFVSRPIYMASECKRMLSDSKHTLTKPTTSFDFSVIGFQHIKATRAVLQVAHAQQAISKPCGLQRESSVRDVLQLANAPLSIDTPRGIPNLGNTCFINAILQCCRQLLSRIPSHLLPHSQQCPLAAALQADFFDREAVRRWPCWMMLPIGPQRDACEVLEMCFDPNSVLHNSCARTACYGVLLQRLTSHQIDRHHHCNHCAYASEKLQSQCILRAESRVNAQNSILAPLHDTSIPDFRCQACGQIGALQQTTLGDLPPFLIVHVNKPGPVAGITAERTVHLSGTELHRFAVVHHTGESTTSGHYTSTVSTQTSAFHCTTPQSPNGQISLPMTGPTLS